MRLRLCLVAACCALAGCGGGDEQQTGGDAAAGNARLRQGTPQSRIREMYRVYGRAVLDRDFGTACARLAPETIEFMRRKLKRLGAATASCEEAMTRVYKVVPKEQREILDEATRTGRITRIKLHGASATIDETATARGQRVAITHGARKIGDEWKLVDTTDGDPRPG